MSDFTLFITSLDLQIGYYIEQEFFVLVEPDQDFLIELTNKIKEKYGDYDDFELLFDAERLRVRILWYSFSIVFIDDSTKLPNIQKERPLKGNIDGWDIEHFCNIPAYEFDLSGTTKDTFNRLISGENVEFEQDPELMIGNTSFEFDSSVPIKFKQYMGDGWDLTFYRSRFDRQETKTTVWKLTKENKTIKRKVDENGIYSTSIILRT